MNEPTSNLVRLKCESCGAEVEINTASALQISCPWCRNKLSINSTQKDGSVPDIILPFQIPKETAMEEMKKYVAKRKFFASAKFKKELNLEKIQGVYFPYFIVDVNADVALNGIGEKTIKINRKETYDGKYEGTDYDIERYEIKRNCKSKVVNHVIESKSSQIHYNWEESTNNIMNAIQPFDVENAVPFDANYLQNFMAIKRDTNKDDITNNLKDDIIRHTLNQINDSLVSYDRGIQFQNNNVELQGAYYKTGYFPIWLYSCITKYKGKDQINYIAINARTGKIMGSIPLNTKMLYLEMLLTGLLVLLIIIMSFTIFQPLFFLDIPLGIFWLYLQIKIVKEYTNYNEFYEFENEEKADISDLQKEDKLITTLYGVENTSMSGANYHAKKEETGKNE